MAFMFYLVLAFLVIFLLALAFLRARPAQLAISVRYIAPGALALFGLGLIFAGRAGLGTTLLGLAAALFGRLRHSQGIHKPQRRRSHVRTAALEMELDLDSGDMNGVVLAGQFENSELDALGEDDLIAVYRELSSDVESQQLMEAYLDRRVPAWRDRLDPDANDGLGDAPRSGPMTEQEAYEILGLGAGASQAEIREAHRRLMKRVHPDAGGSVFLAARINEAKDLLLRRHR